MSTARTWVYHHEGVFIPYHVYEGVDETEHWSVKDLTLSKGLILIASIKRSKVFLVQSQGTKEILICKVLDTKDGRIPPEIRISTAPQAVNCRLPRPIIINGQERILFNELVAHQWARTDNKTVHTAYFRFCNGGNLTQLLDRHHEHLVPVPEHFIWLVALRLIEALLFFRHGIEPGSHQEPLDWQYVTHRDLYPNNIFIHYLPHTGFRPKIGLKTNAFPEIVVGDFGESAMEDWPDNWMTEGIFDLGPNEWEDVYVILFCWSLFEEYAIGENLLLLAQAHINNNQNPNNIMRPMAHPVRTVNGFIQHPYIPYSEDLISMLSAFEYPFYDQVALIDEERMDADGVIRPRYEWTPPFEEIEQEWLPRIRRKVRRFQGIENIPRGYYDGLDVSWARPYRLMPYDYQREPKPAVPEPEALLEEEEEEEEEVFSPSSPDRLPRPLTPPDPNPALIELRGIDAFADYELRRLLYKVPSIDRNPMYPPPAPLPQPPWGGDSGSSSDEYEDDSDSDSDGYGDDDSSEPDQDLSGDYIPSD
ncbi:hypothetical protein F4811DRAFT_572733 [Daldinia bambusicola]|nr:hypothetical protein F4811DRAFT_572733 [Daldinia bambusicola]